MNPTVTDLHVDKVLTNLAKAYDNNDFIAEQMMPSFNVDEKSGIYYVYDQSKFRQVDDLRAAGSRANKADYGMSQTTYGPVVEHALEDDVPDEVADTYPDRFDAYSDATEHLRERILLNKEISLADWMASTSNITQNTTKSGSGQWSDYANSDPISDIETAMDTVEDVIGKRPNTLTFSRASFNKLKFHPQLLELFKYTVGNRVTAEQIASVFDVDRVIIGRAKKVTSAEGQTEVRADVWGKHAWATYVEATPRLKTMTFGFHFRMTNGLITERWYQQPEKSTYVRVGEKYVREVVAVESCYLIANAVA